MTARGRGQRADRRRWASIAAAAATSPVAAVPGAIVIVFALALVATFVACGASGTPATSADAAGPAPSTRSVSGPPAATAVAPTESPCDKAARQRACVTGLLAEGKLDRAARVIDHADVLCSATATLSRGAKAEVLAELGRYDEARAAVAVIESDPAATGEERAAAGQALTIIQARDERLPDTDEAKAEMRRLFAEAEDAVNRAEAGGGAAAWSETRAKYLAAWEAWRPNGQSLYGAGLAARALGDPVGAQRLFDRAMADLERATGKSLDLDVPDGFVDAVEAAAWSPNGKRLAVAHGLYVSILDTKTATMRERIRLGHAYEVTSVAFAPDGKALASGADDATVELWNPATGALIRALKGHKSSVRSVAFSPDGKTLASGSGDDLVRLWNPATGALIRALKGHRGSVRSVAFSPDGKTLASGAEDATVRLWNPWNSPSGALVFSLEGHRTRITSIAFAWDNKTLASGSWDNTVRLWNPATGTLARSLDGHNSRVSRCTYGRRTLRGQSRRSLVPRPFPFRFGTRPEGLY